jgi:hypothetical protein
LDSKQGNKIQQIQWKDLPLSYLKNPHKIETLKVFILGPYLMSNPSKFHQIILENQWLLKWTYQECVDQSKIKRNAKFV